MQNNGEVRIGDLVSKKRRERANGQTVSALRAVTGITVSCMIYPIERGMERAREGARGD